MASPVAAGGSAPTSSVIDRNKSGWLEKFSVGRGILPVRNWQRRWFVVDHRGLNYSKSPSHEAQRRTQVPFVTLTPTREIALRPVFLFNNVTTAIHPEATSMSFFYFGLRFEEDGVAHVLLLRTALSPERDEWVRFIGLFVHSASVAGVPVSHPLCLTRRPYDPEELDAHEKTALRRVVLEWDEGVQHRQHGGALDACESSAAAAIAASAVDSDDDLESPDVPHGAGTVTPPARESRSSRPASPRPQNSRGGGGSDNSL